MMTTLTDDEARRLARGEKSFIITMCRRDGLLLKLAPKALRGDREVVLAAIDQNWRALEYASDNLKDDKRVVQRAATQDGWAVRFAAERLRKDRAFMEEIIAVSPDAVDFSLMPETSLSITWQGSSTAGQDDSSEDWLSVSRVRQARQNRHRAEVFHLDALKKRFGSI